MMTTNKESMSGIIYKGLEWSNTCSNPDQWLTSIYSIPFVEKREEKVEPTITVLVKDGVRVC